MAGILSIIGKRLCGSRFNLWRDKWLVGYTFLAIFQPPFIPVAFIYIYIRAVHACVALL